MNLLLDKKRLTFYAECKRTADRAALLAQVKHRSEGLNKPGIVISHHLSSQMAEQCRAIGLNFVDTAGNAFLTAPGTYIFVKGQKASDAIEGDGGRTSASSSALRIIFALLARPELLRASYREIVDAAGVALGTVGSVFKDLEKRGLMAMPDKQHGRRLLQAERLLDDWTANYPIKLRPKLNARRFRAPDPNRWQNVNPVDLDAWWGGEIAVLRVRADRPLDEDIRSVLRQFDAATREIGIDYFLAGATAQDIMLTHVSAVILT